MFNLNFFICFNLTGNWEWNGKHTKWKQQTKTEEERGGGREREGERERGHTSLFERMQLGTTVCKLALMCMEHDYGCLCLLWRPPSSRQVGSLYAIITRITHAKESFEPKRAKCLFDSHSKIPLKNSSCFIPSLSRFIALRGKLHPLCA